MNHTVLGVPIDVLGFDEAVRACVERRSAPRSAPSILVHVNPHSLVVARSDSTFKAALQESELRVADGAGVLLVGALRRTPFPARIAGPDLVPAIADALADRGPTRFFFYGASDQVLDRIRARFAARWPHVEIAGTLSPPFRPMTDAEEAEHCEIINRAEPHVLWVGMTAPKQELWAHRNRHRLRVPLIGCVGAAFDYLAGTKQRSPKWFRDRGLEWLPRLLLEPRRLWRRNLVSTPLFLWYSLLEQVRGDAESV